MLDVIARPVLQPPHEPPHVDSWSHLRVILDVGAHRQLDTNTCSYYVESLTKVKKMWLNRSLVNLSVATLPVKYFKGNLTWKNANPNHHRCSSQCLKHAKCSLSAGQHSIKSSRVGDWSPSRLVAQPGLPPHRCVSMSRAELMNPILFVPSTLVGTSNE